MTDEKSREAFVVNLMNRLETRRNIDKNTFDVDAIRNELTKRKQLSPPRGLNIDILSQRQMQGLASESELRSSKASKKMQPRRTFSNSS